MITIPDINKNYLLKLNAEYGLSTVVVATDFRVFSPELVDKVCFDGEEMEAYYNHLHLMELRAELEHEAKLHGPFRIQISDGEVRTESI